MKIEIHEGFPSVEVIINCPQVSDEIHKMEAMLRSYNKKLSGVFPAFNHIHSYASASVRLMFFRVSRSIRRADEFMAAHRGIYGCRVNHSFFVVRELL